MAREKNQLTPFHHLFAFACGFFQADNGAMRTTMRIAAMTAGLLFAFLPGATKAAACGIFQLPKQHSIPAPEARVDLNHATVDELLKVPGMTRTWAARIVRFRPYHAKNDLMDRGVVTSQIYERIKDYVIAHRASE